MQLRLVDQRTVHCSEPPRIPAWKEGSVWMDDDIPDAGIHHFGKRQLEKTMHQSRRTGK